MTLLLVSATFRDVLFFGLDGIRCKRKTLHLNTHRLNLDSALDFIARWDDPILIEGRTHFCKDNDMELITSVNLKLIALNIEEMDVGCNWFH